MKKGWKQRTHKRISTKGKSFKAGSKVPRLRFYAVFADAYTAEWAAYSKEDLKKMLEKEGIEYYKAEEADKETAIDYWGHEESELKRGELAATYG
jgi:hypothetical protein